jgi:adenosylcobinamide kinase/adenosylcobinamide-phosphate guanylyltransferase
MVMQNNKIVLVGGGTRSGKSRFALTLAKRLGKKRLFIATAPPPQPLSSRERGDEVTGYEEMADRIRKHQASRGPDFLTREVPLALAENLCEVNDADVVVIDCLTFWLANLLLEGIAPEDIERRVHDLGAVLERRAFHAVVVSSEVGMGIVPESSLGRLFRDVAGLAHQHLSQRADDVYFAVLGTLLRLKPQPAFVAWEEGLS